MNFVKPLHLFEVHIFESTKKNAFSIINSEPTSTVRRKIYADRYEISGGGLTFFQSAKNAADELVEVPVISFPQGKWESVNLIRNKMIIAEHRTGASTGASHVSIQTELKKSKNVSTNTFKIIQMPSNNPETHKEMDGINKLMEQVNALLAKHQDIIDKISQMPAPVAQTQAPAKPEGKIAKKFTEEVVPEPIKESPPVVSTSKTVEPIPEPKSYPKETIQEHIEHSNEEQSLWEDISAIDNLDNGISQGEEETISNNQPAYPSDEPVVHDVSSEASFDDFNIDIDEITAALDSGNDTVGQEAEPVDLNEKVSLTAPPPRTEEKPVPVVKKAEPTPPPAPAAPADDDIFGLLETLSPSLMSETQHKEVKAKKRDFVSSCLNNYIKATDMFKFEYFIEYLSTEKEFSSYNITSNDVEWEIAQLILAKQLSPRKFIKEKLQKHISLLLPGIMKKYWDGNIIPILDIAKTHNEISEMNLIDLAVWMSHNGYK